MGKTIRDRRTEQASYQRAYRKQQKALRKPSRDDVARVALHWIITEALRRDKEGELGKWCEIVISRLVDHGFDRHAAHRRVGQLTEQYAEGWEFQRKPHLTRPDEE
jgi:hypothetical protein